MSHETIKRIDRLHNKEYDTVSILIARISECASTAREEAAIALYCDNDREAFVWLSRIAFEAHELLVEMTVALEVYGHRDVANVLVERYPDNATLQRLASRKRRAA